MAYAIATACFCGLPEAISVLILDENAFLLADFFNGMSLLPCFSGFFERFGSRRSFSAYWPHFFAGASLYAGLFGVDISVQPRLFAHLRCSG